MEATVFLRKDWPKEMEIVFIGPQNFNMNGVCPHCNRPTVLTQVSQPFVEEVGKRQQPATESTEFLLLLNARVAENASLELPGLWQGNPAKI